MRSPAFPHHRTRARLALFFAALAIVQCFLIASSAGASAATCTSTVSSTSAAQTQISSAAPGTVVCLTAGTYGKLTLSGKHSADVTVQPADGAAVTLNGVEVLANSSHIVVQNFVVTNQVDVDTGSAFVTIAHNDISGGYFGVQLYSYDCSVPNAPTWSGCVAVPKVTDVVITGNRIHGFGASAEDAIHLNNFARVTVSYNEIFGVVEGGNHNDCLQSVFGGSDLIFDHNYLHDNNCQGFFLKDGDVTNVTVTQNLFVRNRAKNLDENTFQVFNAKNLIMRNNTDWSGNGEVLRSAGASFTPTATVDHNVLQTFNVLNDAPPAWVITESNNTYGSNPWTFTKNASSSVVASPAFTAPASDDYRIAGSDRGVSWRPADYTYGPSAASTPVDTTPPDTAITSAPSGSTTSTSASVSFSATEAGTFECRIDGGAWSSCTSPKAYSGLAVGTHTVDVRATDAAGNVDTTPATATWSVTAAADTTPPNTSITSAPSGTTTSTSASVAFSATEVVTFECRMDGGAWTACTSPRTYSGLAVGAHTFDVRATDLAGNTDLTPASAAWSVVAPADTTAPDTSIVSGPTGTTTSTSAALAFSATESATFECRLDGGAWSACTSPRSYSGLAVGAHTFDVRATDAAGNLDLTPASRAWTVAAPADTTAPDTTIVSGPSGSGTDTSAALTFSATEAGSTFECRLDGGVWGACTSPKSYSALAVGTHAFDVRATDAAGNTDASPATRSWTVVAPIDTSPPDTAITSGPDASTTATTASVAFTSTEPGSTFQCRLDGGSWSACSSPEGEAGLTVGAHAIDVRATDGAGNVDPTPATWTWTVVAPAPPPPADDTIAPDTNLTSGPTTVTTSRDATVEFTATESPATFRCSLDGSRWSTCTSPKSYSGLSRSRHTIRVRATDAAGNTDATPVSYTWSIVRRTYGATYTFEPLSGGKGTPVQADSLEGACALVPSSKARLGVRLGGLKVRRSQRSMRISGKVPELAQDGVNARVRVSVRSHGRWHLLTSRRVHVRFDGSFSVKAPRRGGKLKVTAVARCG